MSAAVKAKVPTAETRSFSRRDLLLNATTASGIVIPGLIIGATSVNEARAAQAGSATAPMLVASGQRAVVDTTAGKVRGFVRNGIYTFKGIPYGASTAGAARFVPAVRPASWPGVRSCLYYGPVCPQRARGGWADDESAFMFEWDDGQPGEDCLRANVWSPGINDNRKRPVMVWLHGGGFQGGSSQELKAYDGENLARRGDVVLVSINHRLNALGHLNLAAYGERYADSGNVGLLDIVLALQWVRDNIAEFGGDPGNVTLFGQSGGGGKVTVLMAMPAAKGLFHRAIVQSGSMNRQLTQDVSAKLAAATLTELGIAPTQLERLQALPYKAIVDAGVAAAARLDTDTAHGAIRRHSKPWWAPVVDGRALPQHPFDPAAPAISASVPLLVGTVRDESMSGIGKPDVESMTEADLKSQVDKLFGEQGNGLLAAYRRANPDAKPFDVLSMMTGATVRQAAIVQATRKAAQNSAPVFMYWFKWLTPVLDGRPRAFHCAELPFCFNNVDRCAAMTGGTTEAHRLGEQMSDAWIQFARSGNPAHAGLPRWTAFTAENRAVMIFDSQCQLKNDPDPEIKAIPEA
jgi:para-nitrobenzyl esterase